MAGNYYPVSTRIYITVPALPLPQTGSASQSPGAGWVPSRDPHSQSPFYLGRAHAADCGDGPLPGGQQSEGRLTRAHGERGAPPTRGFSGRPTQTQPNLKAVVDTHVLPVTLVPSSFLSSLSCAGIPGLRHHAWLWNYISIFPFLSRIQSLLRP